MPCNFPDRRTLAEQVKAVEPGAVVVERAGKIDYIPFGTCIWTTGIRMHPLAEHLAEVPAFLTAFPPVNKQHI